MSFQFGSPSSSTMSNVITEVHNTPDGIHYADALLVTVASSTSCLPQYYRTEAEQDMVYSCSCFKGGVLISVTSHYLYVFCLLQIKRDQPGSHPAACRYLPLLPATLPPAARLHSLPLPTASCLTPSSGFACVARGLSPALVIPGRTIL